MNPFHYALEGVVVTQLRHNEDRITIWSGDTMTVEEFVWKSFPDWRFEHVSYDILSMILFILSTICLRFIC